MSVTRRFPLAFAAALLIAGLTATFHSAHAQGAAVDYPTGYGKAVQASGDLDSSPAPATMLQAMRVLVPGSIGFSPSVTFWPSAARLARYLPARVNAPEGARRPVLGPAQRQRTIGR